MAAAWTVALERLGLENPVALQLLQACLFMAPEPISLELFLTPPKVNISPEMGATLQNPSRLNRALRQIGVTVSPAPTTASDCEDEWARRLAIDIIAFFFYWGDQRGCREYAVQVVEHWNTMLTPEDPQILKAARWLAFVERQLGNLAVGAAINADCLNKLQASVGHDDEETLDAMMLASDDRRAAGPPATSTAR
ncbi:hypothetical protein M1L60_30760 [Actinoplanes sp. TRM 88003]|uniref:Uncharacterized protein n=1 Tax=Paractinoplanes aksuensis TaxID=2939490 RepID=A0ABT1DW02_9ACTN|nr:hypothetical protein [Actinoplanes aksuensis]MCO8274972.1 hypothetical protein [Actinoplanes aksuensis]